MLVSLFLPSLLLLPSSLGETCELQTKDTGSKEIWEQLEEVIIKREEKGKDMMTMMEAKIQDLEKCLAHIQVQAVSTPGL